MNLQTRTTPSRPNTIPTLTHTIPNTNTVRIAGNTVLKPLPHRTNLMAGQHSGQLSQRVRTNVNDSIMSSYFEDTVTTHDDDTLGKRGRNDKSSVQSIGYVRITELIKKLGGADASNDPFFDPSRALAILDEVKGKLINRGMGNFARVIEQDENLFLESYMRGMHVHSRHQTANESIYRRSQQSHQELQGFRNRLEQLRTARLQLELRLNYLRDINTGEAIKITTLQRFKAWADKEIDALNYRSLGSEELQFVANALQDYAKGIAHRIYNEEKKKNEQAIIREYLSTKNALGAIDREQKDIQSKIQILEKDEIILRDREAITTKSGTPLPSFPLDTLNAGEVYSIKTDKFERCTIEKLGKTVDIGGTLYYPAVISWKVHEGITITSREVLLRAPLLGFLDIRDTQTKPIDFLTGNLYANTSKRIILPKILSKTKVNLQQAQNSQKIKKEAETKPTLFGKIKGFFGKILGRS